ncbi:MAG TPA: metal-dependent hydrolase [Candidatus Deferrimicrobium sp.]
MDTVTHGLTGWLVARALPDDWKGEHRATATAIVVLGSVLPDADNAASLLGSEVYLRIHRGLSHSLLGISISSLFVALLFARFGKWKDAKRLFLLALIGQVSHVVLDLLNAYGTQVFQPFSDARLSLDLLFVVDLVRDAAVRSGVPVVTASALPQLPSVPLPSMDRFGFATPAVAHPARKDLPGNRAPVEKRTVPFPAGPLFWNGFVDDGRTFLRADVDPLAGTVEWKQRARRGPDVPEVRAVRGLADVETYLWFARFPAASVVSNQGRTEVTFYDMRFSGLPGRGRFLLRVIETPGAPPLSRWGS